MKGPTCSLCQMPKATAACGLCQGPVCKKCLEKLPEGHFSLLAKVPPELSHRIYCGRCFDAQIASKLQAYDAQIEQAKAVFVFYRRQGEETRLMKRTEAPITVTHTDRSQALMSMAYAAVQGGFNTLVDVEIKSEKLHNTSGYQTTKWTGIGTPTLVDPAQIHKREAGRANP